MFAEADDLPLRSLNQHLLAVGDADAVGNGALTT